VDIFNHMRTEITLAQWRVAESLLTRHGPETAKLIIEDNISHGITVSEASLLKYMVDQLHTEKTQEATNGRSR
jgi:hypothetical protein